MTPFYNTDLTVLPLTRSLHWLPSTWEESLNCLACSLKPFTIWPLQPLLIKFWSNPITRLQALHSLPKTSCFTSQPLWALLPGLPLPHWIHTFQNSTQMSPILGKSSLTSTPHSPFPICHPQHTSFSPLDIIKHFILCPSSLLRYNQQIKIVQFKVYDLMFWGMYTQWTDHHGQAS